MVYQTHRGLRRIATGTTLAYNHIKASNWSESNGCSHASPRPDHHLITTKQHYLALGHATQDTNSHTMTRQIYHGHNAAEYIIWMVEYGSSSGWWWGQHS